MIRASSAVLALLAAFALSHAPPAAAAGAGVNLLSWGDAGRDGQASASATLDPPAPVALPDGTTVTQIAQGADHALALTSRGEVFAWGANDFGQAGGTPVPQSSVALPAKVAGLPAGIVTLAAGSGFSLAVTASGEVWAWGRNDNGQLGVDPSATPPTACVQPCRAAPAPVPLPAGLIALGGAGSIDGGDSHALAVVTDAATRTGRAVVGWGYNGSGELGVAPGAATAPGLMGLDPAAVPARVSAGNQFSLVTTAAGEVLSCGYGFGGQLGNGDFPAVGTPVLQTVLLPAGHAPAVAVSAGGQTGLALLADGSAWSWGVGTNGERGDGTTDATTNTPGRVALPPGEAAATISIGETSAFASTRSGHVYGWGTAPSYLVSGGAATATPALVALPAGAVATSVGHNTSSAGGNAAYALIAPGSALTPVTGRSAVVAPVSGTVRVRRPGARSFRRLLAGELIPLSSTIDTAHGVVALTTTADRRGHEQSGQFSEGQFRPTQTSATLPVTVLTLAGEKPGRCTSAAVRAAATKRKRKRKLLGREKGGRFRSVGTDASATVRGTVWRTTDRCDGTLVEVIAGVVSVRDNRRGKTVTVRAGHRYLARKRG
ncbi:MAG: hypothetical protein QOE31_556 [Solirubrobacteraceae bacterium]|nr:hypothetical protein [Solirubrobacteraceae bacterium]